MSKTYGALFALTIGVGLSIAAGESAKAQLDPRAGQALALCNSPAGALVKECQQLRGVMGGALVPGTPPGANSQAGIAAAQVAYASCIQMAGINQAAIQACNARLNATMGLPQPQAGPFNQYDRNTNTALNIHAGAAGYQQCVAAMMAAGQQAGGINPCTPLLSGNPAGAGAPPGFGAPQAYNPPAPAFTPPPAPPLDPLAPPSRPFDPLGL